jgi:hypothetical protein
VCDRCRFNVYPDTIRELLFGRWSALVPSRTSQPPSYVDRKIMKKPTMVYTRRSLLPHDTRSNQCEILFHPMKCRSLSHTGIGLIPGSTLDHIGTAVHLFPIQHPRGAQWYLSVIREEQYPILISQRTSNASWQTREPPYECPVTAHRRIASKCTVHAR